MKKRVAVFFGGKSTEHEISCISANQVIHALNSEKYEVIPIYISKDNEFYTGNALIDLQNYSSIVKDPAKTLDKVVLFKDGNTVKVRNVNGLLKKEQIIDIAFPVVHGTNVEDGSLAGFLEFLDIPYTSCDVLGGAIGQDKAVMKDVFKAEGIPMVEHFVIYSKDFAEDPKAALAEAKKIGFPLIAKPANLGSSIGIEIIKTQKEFMDKINECLKYDFKVVVERMIKDLKEVNISVIGTQEECRVSVIEEVTNGTLTFDKKYNPNGSKGSKKLKAPTAKGASKGMASTLRKVPADLPKKQQKTIEEVAAKVFKVLNCHGCVRIDFMIDKETGKVYCNEINTIPGSLAFYLWKENGLPFDKECDLLIENALKRYTLRSHKTWSFDTNILDGYAKHS